MARLKMAGRKVRPVGERVKRQVNPESWRQDKTSAQRGYNYRWQKARARYLQEHPLCVYCEQEHRVTPATIVDHIEPHRGDKDLFWSEDNWQGLCVTCHSGRKQREENQSLRNT